jgi:CO/xanthine dehydrogenase FAD-binding subunit
VHRLIGYHRPSTRGGALELLARPDHLALAGGTAIRHDPGGRPTEVVDLQAAGLDRIDVVDTVVTLGATVDLQTMIDDDRLPALVRDAARRELPSTLRTLATVGGTVARGESSSVLLAALLVHAAEVTVEHAATGARVAPLPAALASGLAPGELIVAVSLVGAGEGALAVTGRTPADEPIVAAAARRDGDRLWLALGGVGPHPVLVDSGRLDAAIAELQPPSDHRGSAEYRRHLASVLAARALAAVRP